MFSSSLIGWLGLALVVSTSALAAPQKKPAARTAKAPAPAASAVVLSPGQLEAASRVLTGAMACEFDQNIQVMPVDGKPGHFTLVIKKTTYALVPQETTTGAVRLEDRHAGVVWLQIPAKSMLLDTRNGRRLVDRCLHEEQRLAAAQPESALGIVELALATASGLPAVTAAPPGAAMQEPLIPRQEPFGPAQRTAGSISPDGQWLAWIAPREGVPNVWVAPVSAPGDSRPITEDRQRGIQSFSFARDGRHLLYAQDEGGNENLQVFAVDLAGGEARPRAWALSPKGSRATIAGLSDAQAGEVLLSVNDRDPRHSDLVRVVIASGERTRVLENDGFTRIVADTRFMPRYASRPRSDGGSDWFVREGGEWKPWAAAPNEDPSTVTTAAKAPSTASTAPTATTEITETTEITGISADGRTLYLAGSRGLGTGALYAVDTTTGARQRLMDDAHARVDAHAHRDDLMVHPVTGLAQAARSSEMRSRWVAIDPAIAADLQRLETLSAGAEFTVLARTRADDTWVVTVGRPDAAARTYLYDRNSGNARLW